ncbi:zinc finger CCCH domain-containing protein 17-like [Asparagus officinalis]|nr:zinc finger CCCH domain-containing protein 17-like [Asparagus officinalis]
MGSEVGCMISEGPWIFIGVTNAVRALNTQTSLDLSLDGPVGLVYALVVGNEMLFAGTQDGRILAWKFNVVGNCFEPAASLIGHLRAVVSLVIGAGRLYSGSMDETIRVWDLTTLQCIHTLTDHKSVVMSVLCWDQFLLSCSLDQTVKVWVATESGNLEVTYTHNEEHGVLALCGMHDAQGKPVLFCASNDNTVRLYDLPSFNERGKIFAKKEIRAIQIGPGGLFFTGDGTGELKVWKWIANEATSA